MIKDERVIREFEYTSCSGTKESVRLLSKEGGRYDQGGVIASLPTPNSNLDCRIRTVMIMKTLIIITFRFLFIRIL
jgi:hypothetical protein